MVLNKKKLLALKNDKVISEGNRNYLDGLWDIPIHKTQLQQDNYINPAHHGLQYNDNKSYNLQSQIYDHKKVKVGLAKVEPFFQNILRP